MSSARRWRWSWRITSNVPSSRMVKIVHFVANYFASLQNMLYICALVASTLQSFHARCPCATSWEPRLRSTRTLLLLLSKWISIFKKILRVGEHTTATCFQCLSLSLSVLFNKSTDSNQLKNNLQCITLWKKTQNKIASPLFQFFCLFSWSVKSRFEFEKNPEIQILQVFEG